MKTIQQPKSMFHATLIALTGLIAIPGLMSSPVSAQAQGRYFAPDIAHQALRQRINRDLPRRSDINFRDTDVRSVGRNEKVVSGSGSFLAPGRRSRRRFTYHVRVNVNQGRATSVSYNVK